MEPGDLKFFWRNGKFYICIILGTSEPLEVRCVICLFQNRHCTLNFQLYLLDSKARANMWDLFWWQWSLTSGAVYSVSKRPVYGIRLYTCKYSPLCSLRDWKLLVPAYTSVPYCIAVVNSLINKQHIMSYFIDVHKILQLVIFVAAIIILGMFGTEVLHFHW